MSEFGKALARFYDRQALTLLTILLSVCLIAVVLWPLSVVQIDAGYSGVLWRRFFGGTDMTRTYGEGTHLVPPWDVMYRYNVRTANLKVDMKVMFPDALTAETQFTLIYRPIPEQLNIIHRFYGPGFENTYLRPLLIREINNAVKDFGDITKVPMRRAEVERTIMEKLLADLSIPHAGEPRALKFFLDEVIIGEIQVPADVSNMIEQKNSERERGEAYVYRIQNETSEAERKRIEARGIYDFNTIVQDALNDHYLKLRAIDASKELAESKNSKIVMFGNRSWGLPLLLDDKETSPDPAEKTAAPALPRKQPESLSKAAVTADPTLSPTVPKDASKELTTPAATDTRTAAEPKATPATEPKAPATAELPPATAPASMSAGTPTPKTASKRK